MPFFSVKDRFGAFSAAFEIASKRQFEFDGIFMHGDELCSYVFLLFCSMIRCSQQPINGTTNYTLSEYLLSFLILLQRQFDLLKLIHRHKQNCMRKMSSNFP